MSVIVDFPNKKYRIIYADPPWAYKKHSNNKDVTSDKIRVTPYPAMDIEDIKKIPVPSITEKDAVLMLWVTFPCLQWGLDVIKAWGFTYKTVGFNWLKKNKNNSKWFFGFGYYTRSNSEVCLLATKGKGLTVLRKDISQIIDTPVTKHSQKPDNVRTKIVQLFGDLPRIELFARTKVHGWDVWGNDEKLESTPLEAFL